MDANFMFPRLSRFVRSLVLLLLSADLTRGQSYDWSGVADLYGNPGIKRVGTTWNGKTVSCAQIDTWQGNLRFYTTERCSPYVEDSQETQTRKTTEFVSDSQSTAHKVVVAINATEFDPVIVGKVNLLGYAAWEGLFVSRNEGPALVVGKDGVPSIANVAAGTDAANMQAAVSGQLWVLTEGTPYPASGGTANRTGVGVSQDGRYVYFLTIGSAQIGQNGEALKYFGAYNAVQLDGGGSTGMAAWNGSSVVSLFSSTRSVGNSIGVYFNNAPAVLARSPATLVPACMRGQDAAAQSIEVWNAGGSNLVYAVADNAAWILVSPTNGASLAEHDAIQVTYATAGLATGTYAAAITITAAGASSSPQTVGVTLTVTPAPGDLPFSDSFESYAPGLAIAGTNGWTGSGVVTARPYAAATPPGYPLPEAAHTRVLRCGGWAVEHAANGASGQNANVDLMVQAFRSEFLANGLSDTVQNAFCVDSNGFLNAWHLHDNGAGRSWRWTVLSPVAIDTNQWVRLSVAMDYGSSPTGDFFFCPRLNGALCPTPYGRAAPNDPTSPGPWYLCANSPGGGGTNRIAGFTVYGEGSLDDVTISTEPFAYTGLRGAAGAVIVIR